MGDGLSEGPHYRTTAPYAKGELGARPDLLDGALRWMCRSASEARCRARCSLRANSVVRSSKRTLRSLQLLCSRRVWPSTMFGSWRQRARAGELDALRTTMAEITAELELSALSQANAEHAAGLVDASGEELGLCHGCRLISGLAVVRQGGGMTGWRSDAVLGQGFGYSFFKSFLAVGVGPAGGPGP